MAERPGIDQVWQRAMEANARYYEALGQLTTDYLKALFGALGDVRLPASFSRRDPAPAPHAPPSSSPAAMVLEGVAGETAVGAFMVQNRLSQKVAAPVVSSAFHDPSGKEVRPALAFEPDVVALEPGEQVLVRVSAAIDDRLGPGLAYRGEVTVPGLSGDRVPLVIRRRVGAAAGTPGAKRPRKPPRSARRTRR